MNNEMHCLSTENTNNQRHAIAKMIEGMTDAQLEEALTLLHQWLLEESR